METTIGTFNLNNLFSRFNFEGEIKAIRDDDTSVDSELKYEFGPEDTFKIRTYMGRLVKAKRDIDTQRIADRIIRINVDILAVQEVEDIDTLENFNRTHLNRMYRYLALIEGNDPRLIDVGVLSKLPFGAMTSWRHSVHSDEPEKLVFGRDLLEIEILNASRTRKLFTIFNNHLKSHFVDFRTDPVEGELMNDQRRARQAEKIAEIVKSRTRPNSSFVILGDMNDPPDSPCLQGFVADSELNLINALENPQETRRAKSDTPPPDSTAWTHRYKPRGQPAQYELYDHIWLSNSLAAKQTEAWIDRRQRHTGDGSDHDPARIKVRF